MCNVKKSRMSAEDLPLTCRKYEVQNKLELEVQRWLRHGRTLSVSLAKNRDPFPIPKVPFFLFPFLSISETDQVLISSALSFFDWTRVAGSS